MLFLSEQFGLDGIYILYFKVATVYKNGNTAWRHSMTSCIKKVVQPIFFANKDLTKGTSITVPIGKIISAKNVRAWVSMDFIQNKFSAPIAIEKIKILGAL